MLKASVTCIAIGPLVFALALASSDMASAKKAKKVAANTAAQMVYPCLCMQAAPAA
jgi:hypothetical protein